MPAPQAQPPRAAPRLIEQLRQQIRYMHYSLRTEEAYEYWVRSFIRYHGLRHPAELGQADVEAYLSWLANERQASAATHRQALSALLFLYQKVLDMHLPWVTEIGRPRSVRRLPVVLSGDELVRLFTELDAARPSLGARAGREPASPHALLAKLLYGTGMRLLEGMRLRVKDIDFDRRAVIVRHG